MSEHYGQANVRPRRARLARGNSISHPLYVLTMRIANPECRPCGTTFYRRLRAGRGPGNIEREHRQGNRDNSYRGWSRCDPAVRLANWCRGRAWKSPWHPCCSAVGGVSSKKKTSNLRPKSRIEGSWMVQLPHTCTMCVSEGVASRTRMSEEISYVVTRPTRPLRTQQFGLSNGTVASWRAQPPWL